MIKVIIQSSIEPSLEPLVEPLVGSSVQPFVESLIESSFKLLLWLTSPFNYSFSWPFVLVFTYVACCYTRVRVRWSHARTCLPQMSLVFSVAPLFSSTHDQITSQVVGRVQGVAVDLHFSQEPVERVQWLLAGSVLSYECGTFPDQR